MTKRIARPDRRSLVPAADVRVTASGVAGRLRPGLEAVGQVIALVDGVALGAAKVGSGGGTKLVFEVTLPPTVLGGSLDVVAAETGASLLEEEIDLGPPRGLRWGGWQLRGRRVSGAFGFDGPAAPDPTLAIPVDIRSGRALFGSCYAFPAAGGAGYQFAADVTTLPPPHETVEVMPWVGGIPVKDRLRIASATLGFAGCADPTEAARAQGWAVDLARPRRRLMVELHVNGRVVATARADRMRTDLQSLGLGDGRCGFEIAFPPGVRLDRDLRLALVIAGTGLNLANSPVLKPASPPYLGFFDALEGPFATGWIVNMHDPASPVRVEAVCDGEVIGSGMASLYRIDVERAGLPTARCGFRFLLERPLPELLGRNVYLQLAKTGDKIAGSPRQISKNHNIFRFLTRGTGIAEATLGRLSRMATWRTRDSGISLVMPVFDPPRIWLVEALNSVLAQWSENWELICIDDGSREPHVREVLESFAARDGRIRVMRAETNVGIARAVNFGLRAARFDYVSFVDHDDVIEPDAVYKLAEAAQATGADLVYSDEVLTGSNVDSVIEVRARPAFSHDYYLSHPYFVHMVCVRASLAHAVAGWDESLPISADTDFVLRVLERAKVVTHVPSVLYRWRTHEGSAGHARRAQVNDATKAALSRHLARLGLPGRVSDGMNYNEYRIDWPDPKGEVLIVIPTKDRADLLADCISSIERTAPGENYRIVVIDHDSAEPRTHRYLERIARRHTVMSYSGRFNFARMNNLAMRQHGGDAGFLLFLNNDVEAREAGWMARLRSLAARPDVGAAGPLLLYGDERVQHAGVVVGFSNAADHAMKFMNAYQDRGGRHPGYNCNLTSVRDYSAVTAACMMMRRQVFADAGGFDESFAIGFNDTDLCLRLRLAGYKVLYDGYTVLYHHESATRTETDEVLHPEDDARLRAHWPTFFTAGDPFYSPLLAPRGTDHTLRTDEGCKGRMQPRAVVVRFGTAPVRT